MLCCNLVPRRIRRSPRRSLLPAASLFPPLLPSPVSQPRLPARLAPLPTPLSLPPHTSLLPNSTWPSLYCHRHHLHGELLVRGARPRLRGVLKSLPPPRVGLAVPRVAHMVEEPVLARRPAVPPSIIGVVAVEVGTYPGGSGYAVGLTRR